jgi:hypothetical protein
MDHTVGTTLTKRYRLVTRSDFDGLVCAALLHELDMLDDTHARRPPTASATSARSTTSSRPTRAPCW